MKLELVIILMISLLLCSCREKKTEYVCTPCDLPCDTLIFTKPGICPHCNMKLVKKNTLIKESELQLNEIDIKTGSGVFLIDGGQGREEKSIRIYYHKPQSYSDSSKVLIVIPGAGRNGDSYRDSWIDASERYGVLVLSPRYSEEEYAFEDYHLCGLINESNFIECVEFNDSTNIAKLNEQLFSYEVNRNATDWIFDDFDRIFDLVVSSIESTQIQYDIFGHSTGGQILHRLAIFHPDSKVDRIIAANSGFYTVPNFDAELPFGINNTLVNEQDLKLSFSEKLVLLIGELDNKNEQGGTLLRSFSADKQGDDRLERGKYFYDASMNMATNIGALYNWEIKIVPNVGHDHEQMGNAAAVLLYR